MNHYWTLEINELKELCVEYGLSDTGNRADLVKKLTAAFPLGDLEITTTQKALGDFYKGKNASIVIRSNANVPCTGCAKNK